MNSHFRKSILNCIAAFFLMCTSMPSQSQSLDSDSGDQHQITLLNHNGPTSPDPILQIRIEKNADRWVAHLKFNTPTRLSDVWIGELNSQGFIRSAVTPITSHEDLSLDDAVSETSLDIGNLESQIVIIAEGVTALITPLIKPSAVIKAASSCRKQCVEYANEVLQYSKQKCWDANGRIGDAATWISRAKQCKMNVTSYPISPGAIAFKAPSIDHVAVVHSVQLVNIPAYSSPPYLPSPLSSLMNYSSGTLGATSAVVKYIRHIEANGTFRFELSDANWKTTECSRRGVILYVKSGQLYKDFDAKKKAPKDPAYTLSGFISKK